MELDIFKEGKFYTCKQSDKRSEDLFFEIGNQYRCISIENKNKFSSKISEDNSNVKFMSHNGVICSFFGVHALLHFTNSPDIIKDIIHTNEDKIQLIDEEIDNLFSKLNELKSKRGNIKTINTRLTLSIKNTITL